MTAWGSLRLDKEMTVLCGVKYFLWKFKKPLLVSTCPRPLFGMPMPFPPKATTLTSSLISSISPSVWKSSCIISSLHGTASSPWGRDPTINSPWSQHPPRRRSIWDKRFPHRSWSLRWHQFDLKIRCLVQYLLILDAFGEIWLHMHQIL